VNDFRPPEGQLQKTITARAITRQKKTQTIFEQDEGFHIEPAKTLTFCLGLYIFLTLLEFSWKKTLPGRV